MLFETVWMDVSPYLLSGAPPVAVYQRPLAHGTSPKVAGWSAAQIARVGDFWVPQGPVLGEGPGWSVSKGGDYVRIPVFAYKTQQRALSTIFGLGIQIGLAALADLRNHTQDVPRGAVLVLGHECHDLAPEDTFRCYVGVAVRTK